MVQPRVHVQHSIDFDVRVNIWLRRGGNKNAVESLGTVWLWPTNAARYGQKTRREIMCTCNIIQPWVHVQRSIEFDVRVDIWLRRGGNENAVESLGMVWLWPTNAARYGQQMRRE